MDLLDFPLGPVYFDTRHSPQDFPPPNLLE